MCQDHDGLRPGYVLTRKKASADGHRQAPHVEHVGRDPLPAHTQRLAIVTRQDPLGIAHRGHRLEGRGALPHVQKISVGHLSPGDSLTRVQRSYDRDVVLILHREIGEDDDADDAENRCIDRDGQRHCRDRDDRERGASPHGPESVLEILPELIHEVAFRGSGDRDVPQS